MKNEHHLQPKRSPTKALVLGEDLQLPTLIENAGTKGKRAFLEFFTATIRNANTRRAYGRAVGDFFIWCEGHGFDLVDLEPMVVATYIEGLMKTKSASTVKQKLAAIRMLFDHLVIRQVVTHNPAAGVRGPKHVVTEGKTPVLFDDDVARFFGCLEEALAAATTHDRRVILLRDRAIIGLMLYSFARVGAVVKMNMRDYVIMPGSAYFKFKEKGGRQHQVEAHHLAASYLDAYIDAAGIHEDTKGPIFRVSDGRGRPLTDRRMSERQVLFRVKRHATAAGFPPDVCDHTWRGTGITNYMENGGSLETAAAIAGHSSTRTTQLYDRRHRKIQRGEIERVRFGGGQ